MSWRDKTERRDARAEVEARRDHDSEGVRLGKFVRLLPAPVVVLLAMKANVSNGVLFALGGVALLLLLAFANAVRERNPQLRTAANRSRTQPAATDKATIGDRER